MWDSEKPLGGTYDFAEFSLSSGVSNYDVKANQANLFNNVQIAKTCIIWTTENITCRFNNTTFPALKIDTIDSPAEITKKLDITNLFLTNSSGSTSTVKIWLIS